MSKELFKEKAYKMLYQKYKSLYETIYFRASNAKEYGQKDDQLKVIETIIEKDKYPHIGIQSESDRKIIEMLEYLLDDNQVVK